MAIKEFRTEDGRTKFSLEVDGSVYGGRPIYYKGKTYKVLWPPLDSYPSNAPAARPSRFRVRLLDRQD